MYRAIGFQMIVILLLVSPSLARVVQEAPAPSGPEAAGASVSLTDLHQLLLKQQKMLEQQRETVEKQAAQLEEQRKMMQAMTTRMDQLAQAGGVEAGLSPEEIAFRERLTRVEETLQNPPDTPENVLLAGDFPGSISVPGSNMAAKVGGFVRLGLVNSIGAVGSDDRFIVGSIPVDGFSEGDSKGITISAKRSRLNLDMRMDSSVGQFRAFLEGDFAGQGGTDNYRLRHAYGQYNRFIIGQTWSTFVDRQAQPEELDFEGLNGQLNMRQPQGRWSRGLGGDRLFAVGLEDPSPEITGGEGISRAPDVSMRLSQQKNFGHIQAGLLLRNIIGEQIGGVEAEDKVEDSVFGWGLTLSGGQRINKRNERDNIKWQLNYGEGIGRYINDLDSVGGQDAVFDLNGQLQPLPAFGGYIAYQHWWKGEHVSRLLQDVRSTLVYGLVNVTNFDFQPDDAYKRTQRATVNLIWSPIPAIDLGLEFLWGSRENKDRSKGTATQFQAVATFRF